MTETLCFIDNDENFFAIRIGLVEEMNEMNQKVTLAIEGFFYFECMRDEIVEIKFFKTRISDHGYQSLVIKAL